jgi:type II secretory pathway pseudopilin PulG
MTFGWVAAGTAVAGALISSSASKKAAQTQADAANRASDLQYQQYQEDVARQKPFYDVGVNALPELVEASKYTPFGMDQYKQDPGYGFRLAEGQKALERSAAARGGLISGGALKAAERYGQDMGSQEYMNAFNRYQTERAARLNPLQSMTGMGQTTANTLGASGERVAGSMGNAYQSAANARASGYVGQANAFTGAANQYLNYNQNQNMIAAFRDRNNPYNYSTTPSDIAPTYSGGTGPTA